MRIIQLIQKPQLRGAEIFASQLSNHLLEEGHDTEMVALFPGEGALPFKGKLIKLNRPPGKRLVDTTGWKLLANHINEFKPDVVQANAGDTLKFSVLSKSLFRWKPPIVFRNANKVSDFIDSRPKLIFNKFLVRHVRHVISVSELCRLDFLSTYSLPPDRATTVPVGVEREALDTTLPEDLKSIFAGKDTVLIHVGSFVPEKNHIGLLKIARKLLEKGENIKVVLVGDGKLRHAIELQISEHKLTGRIFILGYRSDVLSILANAQVFILPSNIEGLPAVILEAMYSRVPVVTYNVGGISEVVKPGDTGWLVPAGDEAAFVEAIQTVLYDSNKEVVTDNAYKLITNEYDNRIIAKRFLEVYRKII